MRDTYQIMVLGPGGVGKTKGTNTLLHILHTLGFQTSEVKPWTESMVTTSSYIIHNFTIPGDYFAEFNDPLRVVIYDMGGQFKYKSMWEMHASDSDALVAVVDTTRKTTLRQIPIMLPKDMMQGIPVRLLVNKADLYQDFASSTENISNNVLAIVQQTLSYGFVDYVTKYKGEAKFSFSEKEYHYGDQIHVMRHLKREEDGSLHIRIGDFESIVASAFSRALPSISEHNSFLFGREFTLQIFDVIYKASGSTESMLTDELIENAHNEAPPFLSWGNDPEVFIPLTQISADMIQTAVNAMLIDEQDLWNMVEKLLDQGYNIDLGDERSWALTSAMLLDDNPNLNYKPMHKAVLPPYFIKKMVQYNKGKQEKEEEFFI